MVTSYLCVFFAEAGHVKTVTWTHRTGPCSRLDWTGWCSAETWTEKSHCVRRSNSLTPLNSKRRTRTTSLLLPKLISVEEKTGLLFLLLSCKHGFHEGKPQGHVTAVTAV